MTIALPSKPNEKPISPLPLSVRQYHRMIKQGILQEGAPIELLDGFLVRKDRSALGEDPMTVGNHHAYVVTCLTDLAFALHRYGCHYRTQQPIAIPPRHEPEPDGSILLGTSQDYVHRKPLPKDVLATIEVADSSLEFDQTTKYRIYARAGIPTYIIVNLPERQVEVYTMPMKSNGRYEHTDILNPKQTLMLPTATSKMLKIPVRNILP